ncbi:MAG TPA: hypothetical protein DCF33_19650 [Saprospirales bacterium]|nr:hypothetical protein [Saprospirales bacterium]
MKTKLFAVLSFFLVLTQAQATHFLNTGTGDLCECSPVTATATTTAALNSDGNPLDIKVVFSQKRIYLVADEMPMKCLKIKVCNAAGEAVIEKCFSSKCAEWFLSIETLPKGDYTLYVGDQRVEKFKK